MDGDDYLRAGLGWGLAFIGLLGGIAMIVWAYNANASDPKTVCIQQHGSWVVMAGDKYQDTCQFGAKR